MLFRITIQTSANAFAEMSMRLASAMEKISSGIPELVSVTAETSEIVLLGLLSTLKLALVNQNSVGLLSCLVECHLVGEILHNLTKYHGIQTTGEESFQDYCEQTWISLFKPNIARTIFFCTLVQKKKDFWIFFF